MAMFNWIHENIILQANDIFSGQSISEYLNFLLKSQFWAYEKFSEYQEERLRIMISHSYENVPFYHDLFKANNIRPSDIKSSSDLYKIPVITKNDLRKHPVEYYLARNISKKKMLCLSSSGSTGKPFTYYTTPEAFSMNYACAIRGWYWMGYRLGDKYAKLSQNPRHGFHKKIQDLVTRSNYLFIRDLTTESLKNIILLLNSARPEFIRCYPDPLFFLAMLINEGERLNYSPKAINTTGNILTPESREQIEKAFGSKVFDSYSCEGSAQFFEGPERDSYFSSMEYAITEVKDDRNNDVEFGMHITTDLWNLAMPFIRYDTQDLIERGKKRNSEIQLDPFKKIAGRNSDILITPSGKFLIVHTFTIFFEYFTEIEEFQVVQEQPDKLKIFLKVNSAYNRKTETEIYKKLGDLAGNDVTITIITVPEINTTPSGKRRFIIRDESIKLPFKSAL